MRPPHATIVLLICGHLCSAGAAPQAEERDLSATFGGLEGTFVVLVGDRALEHNSERADVRFVPASTFKIPNTLIGLETGVAPDAGFALSWDGRKSQRFWPSSWSQDHTLRTAFANGVLWYYQELARRIGARRMTLWVERFGYGNRDTGGGIDTFWLIGPLRISAREQVHFLQRFYTGQLGLSERTTTIAKELFVRERSPDYTLSGKTGTARLGRAGPAPQRFLTWFVGYVEHEDDVIFFALNLTCDDWRACDHEMRQELVLAALCDWDLLCARDATSSPSDEDQR